MCVQIIVVRTRFETFQTWNCISWEMIWVVIFLSSSFFLIVHKVLGANSYQPQCIDCIWCCYKFRCESHWCWTHHLYVVISMRYTACILLSIAYFNPLSFRRSISFGIENRYQVCICVSVESGVYFCATFILCAARRYFVLPQCQFQSIREATTTTQQ